MISVETLAASKKFTSESLLGGGAVVGKNVIISSIAPIDGGNRITFSYTLDNGTVKASTLDVMDGADGQNGVPGEAGKTPVKGVDYFDGEKGDDGFSPVIIITEISGGHKVTITTADGEESFDIMDGKDGSGSSTGEENVIEEIKVNGTAIIPDKNKSVDITVPIVDVDKKYVDTELAKKADTTAIPSLDGYVTEKMLESKGYLTSHQDISGKVDKVKDKSLIADSEIERLKDIKNYDDSGIKADLAKKADVSAIPTKISELQNDRKYQTDTDVTTALTDYATKIYVGEQISNADHLKREIVAEIPDVSTADEHTIYMLKVEDATGNDKYREYLLINGIMQCVGDTSVDLTDYEKTVDVDKKLGNKADKTDIPTVPTNVSEFINDAGYLTEHQDISNLVEKEDGKGLSSNDYTTDEKNKLSSIGNSQGRNLIPCPSTDKTTNGITYTVQSDGSVTANGTASAENNAYYNFAYKTLKLDDVSYTLSCEGLPKSVYVYVYDETISKAVANVSNTPVSKTFVGDSTHIYSLSINVGKGTTVSDLAIKPILEMGTIAHAYEPIAESNVSLKDAIDKKIGTDDVYRALELQAIDSGDIKTFLSSNTKVGTYVVRPAVTGMPIDSSYWMLTVDKIFHDNTTCRAVATRMSTGSSMYYMMYNAADNNYYKGWTKIGVTNIEDITSTQISFDTQYFTSDTKAYYCVRNGICYVNFMTGNFASTITEALTAKTVATGLPKPNVSQICHTFIPWAGQTNNQQVIFFVDGKGNLICHTTANIANACVYTSFSYPVAES